VKRTSIKRYTPLAPTRMVRKRQRRIDRETPAEKTHKRLIRRMTWCLARDFGPCEGPLQAAHLARSRGTGLPHGTQEDTAMLCLSHHDQYDGRAKGPLRDVPHAERMELGADWIREAREFVAHVAAAEEAPF